MVSLGGSVGIFSSFFLNIYYCTWTEMVKEKYISDLEKKNLSSSKTGESVGNAKQTIFYFWPNRVSPCSKIVIFLLV